MPRHAPNKLENYFDVHYSVMQRFISTGFVLEDRTELTWLDGLITLTGTVCCLGGIELRVNKEIEIVAGVGQKATVCRGKYTYHAQFVGGDIKILRYDSPVDHRPFHHKHVFDPKAQANPETDILRLDNEDDTPTMGDVLRELQDWYWAEHEWITQLDRRHEGM